MNQTNYFAWLIGTLILFTSSLVTAQESVKQTDALQVDSESSTSRLILAHYMPWYVAKPNSDVWGWHWTMNHFDPESITNGKRQVASHFYPLIGPYDSGDEHVLEYHLLLMKLSGIDGVIVDWYGLEDFNDYKILHRNTQLLIEQADRLGMKFAICYEDQTIPALIKGQKLQPKDRTQHAIDEIRWLKENWFGLKGYVRIDDRPVLLSFGLNGLSDAEWSRCISGLGFPVEYFSQQKRRDQASGGFDWPIPSEGRVANERFMTDARQWPRSIPVAFPRFKDIYQEANVHKSWGTIADENGSTLRTTLQQALDSKSELIQIATWNDWGEGTIIEPSVEFGYRDLETVQNTRRQYVDANFQANALDLKLPRRLLELRRSLTEPEQSKQLDEVAQQISGGQLADARNAIQSLALSQTKSTEYKLVKDLSYRTGDDLTDYMKSRCRLDLYYPADQKDFATVVWFHGGGLKAGERNVPEELKDKGIAVVAVNYRLSPNVKAPAYIEDAAAAVAWTFDNIEKYGGSKNLVFVSGHSAGGYLTSMVGLDKRWLAVHGIDANQIAGLIPFSGHTITHMTVRAERGIPDKQAIVDDLAPLYHVRNDAPPILLITGDREKELLGRYEETAYFWRMMKVIGHPNVSLVELPGSNHGEMAKPAHPLLLQFIQDVKANQAKQK